MSRKMKEIKDLQKEVKRLLKEKNAILLAHNYQSPEIQDVADFYGDSLELSMKASKTDAEIIVFCGVHFMAETASILCPEKKVLLPVKSARCPMAEMIDAEKLRRKKMEIPSAVVISYVNTTAEVKAESDICCTSANVLKVVSSIEKERPIFMTPDRNLAIYAKHSLKRENIFFWDGYCPIHERLTAEKVRKVKEEHPDAIFLAHPECRLEVLKLADVIASTSGMLKYVRESDHKKFIIGTETGLIYPLLRENPDKIFIPADPEMICPDMKKITLLDVIRALETLEPEVKVPDDIRKRAISAVERMLSV